VDFTPTEEQQLVADMVRGFAEEKIRPNIREWDEAQAFPHEIWRELAELGLLGVVIPEEYGGAGLGYLEYVTVIEELSRVDPSVALSVAAHNSLCTGHIYIAGNDEQKSRYLPKLATGEWIGAWGLTEPGAGSDAAGTRTMARLSSDGTEWVLNGAKTFITNGSYAGVAVILAVTDASAGNHGISAFVVEADTEGFSVGRKEDKLGCRASNTVELILENCVIPRENLLGELNHGFVDALRVLDSGRISIAAMALGLAQGCLDASLTYAGERHQFGRPIGSFEAIQAKLVTMSSEVWAARHLVWHVSVLKNAGDYVKRQACEAKLYSSEVAVRCAEQAVQIFGGYGFVKDYGVEKFYRDVKLCTIGEGTSEMQRLVISRELTRQG
jgi:alkylation response protein AidB-like acyl-CoA dehydrogenase